MEAQPIFLAIIFILVAAALTYMVMNINNPPITYNPKPVSISIITPEGSECASGQEKRCAISGCTGVKKCSSGYWTECRLEKECGSGEAQSCQYSPCSDGIQECDACGKWGQCKEVAPQSASCNASSPCNSSGA